MNSDVRDSEMQLVEIIPGTDGIWEGVCVQGDCIGGSLPTRGVCIQEAKGVCIQEGLHRKGSTYRGVCIQGTKGVCVQGGLHLGGFCIKGGSASRGVCLQGRLCRPCLIDVLTGNTWLSLMLC